MFAIISDIHIGVHRSDPKYLKWTLEYCDFLIEKMKEMKCRSLFILGDVFHNRKEVSTTAIETAGKFFDKLRKFNIDVDVIPGNHDCYYDSSTEATSLALLSGWENVHVHYSPYEINDLNNIGLIVPWGTDLAKVETGKYKYLMGHFEITSFNMTASQVCENGISSDSLFSIAPIVFSGHFHLRAERNYKNGRNKIIYVGSPFELDWGDYNSTKGIYFFNPDYGEYSFVENTVSPKHIRLTVTDETFSDKEKLQEFKTVLANVRGNIVKLCSDESAKMKQKDLQKVIEIVGKLEPGELTCEMKSSDSGDETEIKILGSLEPCEALVSYIDQTCTTNVDEIKKIVMDLYSQTKRG